MEYKIRFQAILKMSDFEEGTVIFRKVSKYLRVDLNLHHRCEKS